MSIHERIQNLDFEISNFHRERIDIATQLAQRCEIKDSDEARGVYQIWGNKPIVVSDFHHALFDPLPYVLIGDLLFAKFLKRSEYTPMSIFHLIWEPHPIGVGSVELIGPSFGELDKLALSPAGANISSWEIFSQDVSNKYYFFSSEYHYWREFIDNFSRRFERSDLPNKSIIRDKCLENLKRLKTIYDESILRWTNQGSINDLTIDLGKRITKEVFGIENISHLPIIQSYRNSDFVENLWRTIELFQNTDQWGKVLKTLFAEKGEQFLFVGGNSNYRMWVDYSPVSGFSLKQNRVEVKISHPKGDKLSDISLVELLKERKLVPANLIVSVALAFVSQYLPVIRDANDYGKRIRAANCFQGQSYHQLFADNQDGWSPVKFGRKNFVGDINPSMASLFVWNPGNGYYQEALQKSLASGEPVKIFLEDLAERF